VLSKPLATEALSESDVDVIRKFVQQPQAFVQAPVHGTSQLQVGGSNPFGDYAPQSTQIQGILKGMYDAFTSDIEKNNAEEADSQKAFEELMATKKKELDTLEITLETQSTAEAEKNKQLADSTTTRDDTKEQVKADEKFFEEAKLGCKNKAKEWSERSRLRTEELTGINKGLEILTSPEAQRTFSASATTFLELQNQVTTRSSAFEKLRRLASRYGSSAMAKLAAKMKTGGHFDKIMVMIDEMVADLRKEEAEDIAHRDRCENQGNANANAIEDLENDIAKHGDNIQRMENRESELKATIEGLEGEMGSTKADMEELLSLRNDEVAAFKQALKDDADAVNVISQAIVVMSKFYKENKIPLQLVQEPEYSVDEDKAPETKWNADRSRESGGIIAILEMVKEDTEKEMKESIADDKANQAEYEKNRGALQETLDAQTASKVEAEKELANLEQKMQDTKEAKEGKINDLAEANALKGTLGKDCAWVKTHFDSRREKRKAEIEGLQEAKNSLAGAGIDAEDDLD
jgi:hypothetical protein